jgi:hypothetical protein
MRPILLITVSVLLISISASSQYLQEEKLFKANLSEIKIPAALIGKDLDGPDENGFLMDNIDKPGQVRKNMKSIVPKIQSEFKPLGVTALGDFIYRSKKNKNASATIKIYVFKDQASCSAFWQNKYATHIHNPKNSDYRNRKSIEYEEKIQTGISKKKALFFSNIFILCESVGELDFIPLLDRYVDEIEAKMR